MDIRISCSNSSCNSICTTFNSNASLCPGCFYNSQYSSLASTSQQRINEAKQLTRQSSAPIIRTQEIYNCPICHEKFSAKDGLTSHTKLRHSDVKLTSGTFICEQCNKSFKYKQSLTRHKKKHDQVTYDCHCGVKFDTKASLINHQKIIHSGSLDRKEECPVCDAKFLRKEDLIKHMNVAHSIGQASSSTIIWRPPQIRSVSKKNRKPSATIKK